jgi:tRNA-dihydrouridine synthase
MLHVNCAWEEEGREVIIRVFSVCVYTHNVFYLLSIRKDKTGDVNFDAIKRLKAALKIPVIANGGCATKEDADLIMKYTGCDGVMSSEAILENPAIFDPEAVNEETKLPLTQYDVVDEYMKMAKKYTNLEVCGKKGQPHVLKMVRAHLFKMLHYGFQVMWPFLVHPMT